MVMICSVMWKAFGSGWAVCPLRLPRSPGLPSPIYLASPCAGRAPAVTWLYSLRFWSPFSTPSISRSSSVHQPHSTHDNPGMMLMPRMILGTMPPPPRQAEMHIREYMRCIKPGTVRSESDPDDLWELFLCLVRKLGLWYTCNLSTPSFPTSTKDNKRQRKI